MREKPLRLWAVTVADAGALAVLRPHLGAVADGLRAPHAWFARLGTDRAVAHLAGAALWLVALWLGIGLAAMLAMRLPGMPGRVAGRFSRLVLPGALRRVLAGSAGLGVFLAPAVALAAPSPGGGSPGGSPGGRPATSSIPAPIWPHSPRTSEQTSGPTRPEPATSHRVTPDSSAEPTRGRSASPVSSVPSPPRPSRSVLPPQPASTHSGAKHTSATRRTSEPRAPRSAIDASPPLSRLRVRPGDSLWLLAARRLGTHATDREIADYWPQWYAANRSVIGGDPALITPGEVLRVPGPTSDDTP